MNDQTTVFYCDVCGQPINDVKDGYVIWNTTDQLKSHGFKIIHKVKCDLKGHIASSALEDFLGPDGLTYLLSKLSFGPLKKSIDQPSYSTVESLDEFIDLIRRLQIPNYEEARRYFSNPEVIQDHSDSNEVSPYMQSELTAIAKTYGHAR